MPLPAHNEAQLQSMVRGKHGSAPVSERAERCTRGVRVAEGRMLSKSLPAMQRRRRSSMRRKIYTMAERTADGVTGVA